MRSPRRARSCAACRTARAAPWAQLGALSPSSTRRRDRPQASRTSSSLRRLASGSRGCFGTSAAFADALSATSDRVELCRGRRFGPITCSPPSGASSVILLSAHAGNWDRPATSPRARSDGDGRPR
jgi:hypothetical protein